MACTSWYSRPSRRARKEECPHPQDLAILRKDQLPEWISFSNSKASKGDHLRGCNPVRIAWRWFSELVTSSKFNRLLFLGFPSMWFTSIFSGINEPFKMNSCATSLCTKSLRSLLPSDKLTRWHLPSREYSRKRSELQWYVPAFLLILPKLLTEYDGLNVTCFQISSMRTI